MTRIPDPPPSLTEFDFRSSVPIVGGLINWFRRAWHSMAGRWALRWLAQQQSKINTAVSAELAGQSETFASLARDVALFRRAETALAERLAAIEAASARLREERGAESIRIQELVSAVERAGAQLTAMAAEARARQDALARNIDTIQTRQDALAREFRDAQAAENLWRNQIETATQTYLEELGFELADLARRMGGLVQSPRDGA
ncbi:MAG: hypothetical protein ABIQ99_00035 [Thermoflexales bacterium]